VATSSAADAHRSDARLTGVAARAADVETLELALNLHPSTERVFVVAQALTATYLAGVQAALARFRERVEITFISERSVPRLLDAVRAVPARSLILFIRYSQQDPGQVMFPNEVVRVVAEASPVPVYVSTDSHVGTGAVGGAVRVAPEVGKRVGEIVRRVLDGTPVQDIPFEPVPASPVFDWRQVRRWGIDTARLPAESEILFRVPTVWEQYRWYIVGALSLIVFQTLLVVTLLLQRRQRRHVEAALRKSEEKARTSYDEVRDLAGRLISAREGERTRIARDLHDDIGQRVASLSIALSRIQRQVPEVANPVRQSLSDLEQQSTKLSADLRHLSHELHPGVLEHLGLLEALRERCDDFSEKSGIPVRLAVSETWQDVSDAPALCLYRVAQEALRNVATHARARNVIVSLDRLDGRIMMQVTDDGCGFDPTATSRRSGLGLVSLSERVRFLGGELVVTAAPDAGTRIAVSLPTGEFHAS
jgi:signal transduction histidine kinase